jgi:hypothetical protein
MNGLNGLDFNDDGLPHNVIDAKRGLQGTSVPHDGEACLVLELHFELGQLIAKTRVIRLLSQARPQLRVNDHRRADDLKGQFVDRHARPLRFSTSALCASALCASALCVLCFLCVLVVAQQRVCL